MTLPDTLPENILHAGLLTRANHDQAALHRLAWATIMLSGSLSLPIPSALNPRLLSPAAAVVAVVIAALAVFLWMSSRRRQRAPRNEATAAS